MPDDTPPPILGYFGCKHRSMRFCLLKGETVTARCEKYEESDRMKALRELTALTEELGGYDHEDKPCPTK